MGDRVETTSIGKERRDLEEREQGEVVEWDGGRKQEEEKEGILEVS